MTIAISKNKIMSRMLWQLRSRKNKVFVLELSWAHYIINQNLVFLFSTSKILSTIVLNTFKMKFGAIFALFWCLGVSADLTDFEVIKAYCHTMAGSDIYRQFNLGLRCHLEVKIFTKKVNLIDFTNYCTDLCDSTWLNWYMRQYLTGLIYATELDQKHTSY